MFKIMSQQSLIFSLQSNMNRKMILPAFTKNMIIEEMKHLPNLYYTYVYKFTCKVAMKQKFCNKQVERQKTCM